MPELPDEDLPQVSPADRLLADRRPGGQVRRDVHSEAMTADGRSRRAQLYPETLVAIYGQLHDPDVHGSDATEAAPDPGTLPTTGSQGPLRQAGGGSGFSPAASPPGAPLGFVRRGSPAPAAAPPPPLTAAAARGVQSAFLRQDEVGGMAFDVDLDDAVLGPMTLTIAVHEGRATARICVADANARRLVDAEQGRLHAALRQRGFKVDALEITMRSGPKDT